MCRLISVCVFAIGFFCINSPDWQKVIEIFDFFFVPFLRNGGMGGNRRPRPHGIPSECRIRRVIWDSVGMPHPVGDMAFPPTTTSSERYGIPQECHVVWGMGTNQYCIPQECHVVWPWVRPNIAFRRNAMSFGDGFWDNLYYYIVIACCNFIDYTLYLDQIK
jgi:hypothetical protein